MQPGKRYWITAWIYVPSTTGLNPTGTFGLARGLRIVGHYKVASTYTVVTSGKASVTNSWQQLSLLMSVPAGATEAFLRLYDGFNVGQTDKFVYWDSLSLREVTGITTVESITPTRDGLNVLSVQSRSAAGLTSDPKVYEFLVSPSIGAWHWSLDQTSGGTAASVPDTRPAVLSATGVSWLSSGRVGSGAISLTGAGDLSTSSPVLNTTHSAGFTVAAWARLTGPSWYRAAVSQDGMSTSMFQLGYRDDVELDGDGIRDQAWCFTIRLSDTSSTIASAAACTTDYVVPGDWVSLVGIFDKPSNKIKLFVNGLPIFGGAYVEAAFTGGWSATGAFAIGRAWHNAAATDRWIGDLDHVYAAQQVWSDIEVDRHAFP